jgi:NADH dehydrogenase
MTDKRTHVVVIGGGYAGTLAANHLRMRDDVDITLVNPRPVFVERIRLHQLAAGNSTAAVDYRTLLGEGIRLVVDGADWIDTAERTVSLTSGARLKFDFLIYAVGSTGGSTVPGAEQFAYFVADFEQAGRLGDTLRELHPDAPVLVVGAGLTGVETASELAEQGRRVTLACGGVLGPSLSRRGRRSVAKRLAKLDIDVLETAVVSEVRSDAVVLADGSILPSAVTVWAAGFRVPDLAARSGLRADAAGRLLVDETLTSVDDPRIVAAGDAAAPSGTPLRMSCQAALPLGAQAANTVLSRITGAAPPVLSQAFAGQCVSLGREHATIQLARTDDTPINAIVGGRAAAPIKEVVCKSTLWFIRREAAKPGSYRWVKGGRRPEQLTRETAAVL